MTTAIQQQSTFKTDPVSYLPKGTQISSEVLLCDHTLGKMLATMRYLFGEAFSGVPMYQKVSSDGNLDEQSTFELFRVEDHRRTKAQTKPIEHRLLILKSFARDVPNSTLLDYIKHNAPVNIAVVYTDDKALVLSLPLVF